MNNAPFFPPPMTAQSRVWAVGALCHAIADALQARFNPVAVEGEISGLSRAASGHVYFSLKDASGQLRCAMFKRAASLLDFMPRDGEKVTVKGRLTVYEPRGELQMVVESMSRSGQGALFEQFLRLKARLQEEGLFDAARKREQPLFPHAVAVVTSLNAAALQDVIATLSRRCPHIPVLIVPAPVQGAQAAAGLVHALGRLYEGIKTGSFMQTNGQPFYIDTILLVRGGGSMEDLWCFNDERLARTIVQSPVPLISGVGHETDFTIADFCADVRAPTPTAAAELVATSQTQALGVCTWMQDRLAQATDRWLQDQHQRIDKAAVKLMRPSALLSTHRSRLQWVEQKLQHHMHARAIRLQNQLAQMAERLPRSIAAALAQKEQTLERASLRLEMLNPQKVLERGYAIVQDTKGKAVKDSQVLVDQQLLSIRLAKGDVNVRVTQQPELDF